ncbi:hypothetical protein [Mucilaginibacter sp. SG564]|uniref:hypothetical protein n=1 Tax=Mucilaginibacter sp. SG564 TaxID=2587022 RepID=UPI001555706B|nr:hypothetical protein [Mucilaginibacter sp. SG564]
MSPQVTKKAVSRNASLPHMALALQTGQNHGLLNLTSTSFAHITQASGKVRYALATAPGHHCSVRFRPKLIC